MVESIAAPRRVVAVFDVDGTITTRDTLLPFLVLAFGRLRVALAFLACARTCIMFALGSTTIDALKRCVIAHLFDGERSARLRRLGTEHAVTIRAWLRPAALHRLRWHRERGHEVVLASATLDLYLVPLAAYLGVDGLLCTRLSTHGEFFDGGIRGVDCTGPEKLRRLERRLGDMASVELHAYGDSEGDRALLDAAQHPNYRPFR